MSELLLLRNVVGHGVGYKIVDGQKTQTLATTVYVEKKVPAAYLPPADVIPASAFGLPTDVVQTGEIRAYGVYTGKVRPVKPGYSIGHFRVSAGTLGAIVKHQHMDMLLSNNHVLADSNRGVSGHDILQPGPMDGNGDRIATLYDFVEMYMEPVTCSIAYAVEKVLNTAARFVGSRHRMRAYSEKMVPNYVDAAVALPLVDVDPEIQDIGRPHPRTVKAELNMPVHKTGRTTGHTRGVVTQILATVTVRYPNGVALFRNQIGISTESANFGLPGDSGSLILSGLNPAALLFAGGDGITFGNPIDRVMKDMKVRF